MGEKGALNLEGDYGKSYMQYVDEVDIPMQMSEWVLGSRLRGYQDDP